VENIGECMEHIPAVLERVKSEYIKRIFKVDTYEDSGRICVLQVFTTCSGFFNSVCQKNGKVIERR
jgi:hypothetical protein